MAEAINNAGSEVRASCHTGIAVFEISTAVYPASGTPSSAEANELTGSPNKAAAPAQGGVTASTHDPTLIGDCSRNTRSIARNLSGRPRSAINRTLPIPPPTNPTQ